MIEATMFCNHRHYQFYMCVKEMKNVGQEEEKNIPTTKAQLVIYTGEFENETMLFYSLTVRTYSFYRQTVRRTHDFIILYYFVFVRKNEKFFTQKLKNLCNMEI